MGLAAGFAMVVCQAFTGAAQIELSVDSAKDARKCRDLGVLHKDLENVCKQPRVKIRLQV